MAKLYQIHCPKCNNNHSFYRYGKDKAGFQKYLCRKCGHQFAPDAPAGKPGKPRTRPYPSCPVCGKATFLHHDKEHYSNYRCCDKKCNHSLFVPKPAADALSCPCHPHGLVHVINRKKLLPQYRSNFAYCNEYPSISHDHQQLVYQFRSLVSKHRLAARSGTQFQL